MKYPPCDRGADCSGSRAGAAGISHVPSPAWAGENAAWRQKFIPCLGPGRGAAGWGTGMAERGWEREEAREKGKPW